MNKVVYNACYGGFSLSAEAVRWLAMHAREDVRAIARKALDKNPEDKFGYFLDIARHDPDLVRCVEVLGNAADGYCANLEIKEINSNRYRIYEYDGSEDIVTPEEEQYITIE